MLSYTLEQIRKERGLTQPEFTEMVGIPLWGYQNIVHRVSSISRRIRHQMYRTHNLTIGEKSLISRAYIINEKDTTKVKQLIEDTWAELSPTMDPDSPYRIRNNKEEYYELLNSIPDMSKEDPNSPKLQKLRRMMGEAPIWDNPESLWEREVEHELEKG